MIVGAYAIGATEGYVYVRAEYPLAVEFMAQAIEDARAFGLLGENILGTGHEVRPAGSIVAVARSSAASPRP